MVRLVRSAVIALVLATAPVSAAVVDIDLNDFFADPTVTVTADGSMATFAEDPFLIPVILSNDPGLGDPNVIIPSAGAILSFAYDFVEPGPDNFDAFAAFVLDATTGLSLGGPFEFVTQSTSSGVIQWDLSSLVGQQLGLQFQLEVMNGDNGLTSTLKISDVQIDDGQPVSTVPEPGTSLLLLSGIALVAMRRRKRQ